MKWVDQIGRFKVKRWELPRPGGQAYIPLSKPTAFVLHTTEGTTVDGAWSTLKSKGAGPHFIIGEGQIVQTRPLDAQAATLVGDPIDGWFPNSIGWQVEMVGRSQTKPWLPPASSLEPLLALMAWAKDALGVPFNRPNGWLDDGSDINGIWASNNSRRRSKKAIGFNGWIGHLDVPGQDPTWHYDPGAFKYADAFDLISEGGDDEMFEKWKAGWDAHDAGAQLNPDWPADKKEGWRARNRVIAEAATAPGPHQHEAQVVLS